MALGAKYLYLLQKWDAPAYPNHAQISSNAYLLITLIEVGSQIDEVGTQITQARNTQNTVRSLYFAALDPVQERLRQELALSNISYLYRPSDIARSGKVVSIDEAIIALACFTGNTHIIIAAKKDRGQLYPYYKDRLFPRHLAGMKLYRYVQYFRCIDSLLQKSEDAETAFRRRAFYRHGRYFIIHIFARRDKKMVDDPQVKLNQQGMANLSRKIIELAEFIYTLAEARYSSGSKGYLSIFRNQTDAVPLAQAVMQKLEEQDAQKIQQQGNNGIQALKKSFSNSLDKEEP
jgi:hypothetical protein